MVFLLLCPYAPLCKHRQGGDAAAVPRSRKPAASDPAQSSAPACPPSAPAARADPVSTHFPNLFLETILKTCFVLSRSQRQAAQYYFLLPGKSASAAVRVISCCSRIPGVFLSPLPTCLWEPNSSSGQGSSRLSSSYSHRPYVAPPRLCPRCRVWDVNSTDSKLLQ